MTFDEWIRLYAQGKQFDVVEGQFIRDAWDAAIVCERERCARLADRYAIDAESIGYSAEQNAAEVIASQIRRTGATK